MVKKIKQEILPIMFSLFSIFLTELYYTCYYPESDAFRNEVASIVNYFRQNGYNVIMDVMVSTEITSQGPTRWGESQIRKAKKVLVFLSPGLINLALDGCDGFQSQVNTWYFSFWNARLFRPSAVFLFCSVIPSPLILRQEFVILVSLDD